MNNVTPANACTLTDSLEIFDSVNNEWEVYDGIGASLTDWPFVAPPPTFDNTFGTRGLEINTAARDDFNVPTTINMRWVVTDALSTVTSGGTVY